MLHINQKRTLLYTFILFATLWTAHALLAQTQNRTPLPHVPQTQSFQTHTVQPQVPHHAEPQTGTLTYALTRTPPARLEQALRDVCGHRFTIEAPNRYVFTVNPNNVRRQATLRADPQSNRAFLTGDKQLCDQIFLLLSAIDQPLPPGKGRQIVPYQYTPLDVLHKAFEAHRTPAPRPRNDTAVRLLNPPPDSPQNTNPQNPIQQVTHQFEGGFDTGMTMQAVMPMQGGIMPGYQMFGGSYAVALPEDFRFIAIPWLDVIVVEAEGARLNKFIEMIRQLEELSKLNRPKIEIVYLKHVNNVSLASAQGGILAPIQSFLFQTIPGQVVFTPMTSPNAIMLAGWGEAMDVAKEIIEALDQPTVTEFSRLHIFKLKHISATQARNVLQSTFPQPAGLAGFAARLQMFIETRSNTLIVQGAPNEMEEVKRVLHEIDVADSEFKLQMQTFRLKNSLANDVATTLTNAITGTLTDNRIPAIELMIQGPEGQRLIKSGILADVTVSTDVRNNQVLVRAPESCMLFIRELINLLDIASPEVEIKIFQIENGDANSLAQMLEALIPSNADGMGPQLPGGTEGDVLIPLRYAVDQRTNCIIVAGSVGDLRIVDALLHSLDREDMLHREVMIYRLKSMEATAVALTVNEYLRSQRDIRLATPGVIAPFQQIESEVIIVPDTETNSLIIGVTPRYHDEVMNLIKEIDRSPPQVVIRVMIVEVTLSDVEEWASEIGLQDPLFFKRGSGYNFTLLPGLFPDGKVAPDTTATRLVSGFGGAAVGGGGLVFAASSEYIDIMLRALQEQRRLEVLSSPQIATMNNSPATVSVGQKVPRFTGMQTYQGQTNTNFEDVDVMMELAITPTISPEGTIVMRVVLEKNKIGPDVRVGDINVATIDTTTLGTMVTAANNQTVVLGGLISNDVEKERRKTPLLGDIPVLGKMFRVEVDKKTRKELMVILTPRIIDSLEDYDNVRRMEMARLHYCRHNLAEIYGDIGSYSVDSERPYTGNVPIIRPEPVKMETLQRLETQPFIAPTLPRRN